MALQLDFTNVQVNQKMEAGTKIVTITNAETKTASTGSPMIAVTYTDDAGGVAFDNFVLLPQSLWELKIFLEAVFQTPFTSKINFEPKSLKGKRLVVTVEDEEYVNTEGKTAIRSRVFDYKPLSVTEMMGVTPTTPFAKPADNFMGDYMAGNASVPVGTPVSNVPPVAPAQPVVNPTPAPVSPVVNPAPTVAPTPTVPVAPTPSVQPQQPAVNTTPVQPQATPVMSKPKLPWEM